jgi:hypothetical protein
MPYSELMKFCEKNVGMIDRVIRIVVGFFVLAYGVKFMSTPLNVVVFLVGLAILLTGAIGSCCLYSLLGISTAGKSAEKAKPAAPAPSKSRKKK